MKIELDITAKYTWDKKAKCWLLYSRKYDLYGYGSTKERAKVCLIFCINEILTHTKP